MKVLRAGAIIEVDEMVPGDIVVIEDNAVPVGHIHIVDSAMVERINKEREAMGIPEVDDDFDWDDEYEDY